MNADSLRPLGNHQCRKCGWCPVPGGYFPMHGLDYCEGGTDAEGHPKCGLGVLGEHQHRTCGRCGYVWAEEVAGYAPEPPPRKGFLRTLFGG